MKRLLGWTLMLCVAGVLLGCGDKKPATPAATPDKKDSKPGTTQPEPAKPETKDGASKTPASGAGETTGSLPPANDPSTDPPAGASLKGVAGAATKAAGKALAEPAKQQ